MKKLLAIVLTAALLLCATLALVSCGVAETPVTVTIVNADGVTVVDAAGTAKGDTLQDALASLGYIHVTDSGVSVNALGCADKDFTDTVNGAAAELTASVPENAEIVITCSK